MPNKQSRTQSKRKTNGSRSLASTAAGPVWPAGNPATELKTFSSQSGNYQLYHNTPAPMANITNLFDSIIPGSGYTTRVGARIFAKRLRARIVFNNKTDRPNVSYRVAVTAAPSNTNTDSFAELFFGGGVTGTHIPAHSLLLYDTVFPLNQGSGMDSGVAPLKERSFNHVLDIPINHHVVYNGNDSKASTSLSVWFVPYDAYGTLPTDNIASVAQVTWAIDYTDS